MVELIIKILINTLLVSIPEELFVVGFCLVLQNKFRLVEVIKYRNKPEIRKTEIIKFLIPVILSALISNILRFNVKNIDLASIIPALLIFLLIIFIYKIRKVVDILKLFVNIIITLIVLITVELTYVPIIIYATGKTVVEINNSIMMNLVSSLPARLICYSILAYLILKRIDIFEVKVVKIIRQSKIASLATILLLVSNLSIMFYSWKLTCFDKILSNFSLTTQVLFHISIVIFPVLNITGLWTIIYFIKRYEQFKLNLSKNRILLNIDALEDFLHKGQFNKIEMALGDLKNNVENLDKI